MNLAEFIIQVEAFNANINILQIRKAHEFSVAAHAGQIRESGEPFVVHCLNVALILAELHLDSTTIAAGLLHDVVEDTNIKLEKVREEFGEEIAELVDGVTKLGMVEFKSAEEQQVEYFRKMLLSMARDIRVILIKLADRLHNMRTLEYLPPKKRKRIASETREVYAPLAHRFGINKVKSELEDLSLKFLMADVYSELAQRIELTKEERESYIQQVVEPISEAMFAAGIKATVSGRAKHIDSIYRKIRYRKVPFDQIADLFAIRVITTTKTECYHALGIIHELWNPVGRKFADYIANPKPNKYQSLHTAIFGPENKVVEIQIRTREMHHVAENGIAAHWLYKEGRQQIDRADQQMLWLRDVLEWQKDMTNPSEFLEYLKVDLFTDDIYVYTPAGEIKHLPAGASALDFAFYIHTEVGLHCSGAKINGRIRPLSTKLQSGDEVEIMTNPHRHPSQDWLTIVSTSNAKSKIRRWLKQAGYDQAVALGRELLERELKKNRFKMPSDEELLEIAQGLSHASISNLFYALGRGQISAQHVAMKIIPEEEEVRESVVEQVLERFRTERGIRVQGLSNMMFRFAGCCQPIPGENIVGYITRGRGVTIHQADCPSIQGLAGDTERIIPVSWDVSRDQTFVVRLQVTVEPRKNVLVDITDAIADNDTNVRGADINISEASTVGVIVIEVKNLSQLERVLKRIRKVKGVISVRRASGSDGMPE
ncbi:MAG: bifunctional (p)ppGpp synthetase/guanosine-3',5'-bis(diphosphate) 3'-pyrophosphohydrolase [Candidatus Zixiibacteriota bacterium]|nr:MAG: bifunctional (p)ppGpp synthetase/guanosine-3',5'-bis(diphosphate) 3'-pyrophosphohydrolase [candidate division Zixibacteria bacterium]